MFFQRLCQGFIFQCQYIYICGTVFLTPHLVCVLREGEKKNKRRWEERKHCWCFFKGFLPNTVSLRFRITEPYWNFFPYFLSLSLSLSTALLGLPSPCHVTQTIFADRTPLRVYADSSPKGKHPFLFPPFKKVHSFSLIFHWLIYSNIFSANFCPDFFFVIFHRKYKFEKKSVTNSWAIVLWNIHGTMWIKQFLKIPQYFILLIYLFVFNKYHLFSLNQSKLFNKVLINLWKNNLITRN